MEQGCSRKSMAEWFIFKYKSDGKAGSKSIPFLKNAEVFSSKCKRVPPSRIQKITDYMQQLCKSQECVQCQIPITFKKDVSTDLCK